VARHSSNLGAYLKWIFLCFAGGAIAIVLYTQEWFPNPLVGLLWFLGVPGLLVAYLKFVTRKYKITRKRVETEHGVISKTVDTLELWRVLDVRYTQSLLDRMTGNAKITLIGTDQSDSELHLFGMPNHRELFEQIRESVQVARHTSRPMELVSGQDGAEGFGEMM
jgi:uncharacterized membrane protein YdbT with pleckstrin-like domain